MAFCVLSVFLGEHPKTEPADCLYEVYSVYWAWVADGGLHDFA
jgi:hypothetical protein